MVALSEVADDIVASGGEARFRDLMEAHHYLGALPGMGETVRYVAHHRGLWLALLVFSAPALKCRAAHRDGLRGHQPDPGDGNAQSSLQQSPRVAQYGCNANSLPILPLTADRAAIGRALDGLSPTGPQTHSALDVLWGQRLLSHNWRSVWGGRVHPVDPDEEGNAGARKAIVLLTDGEDTQCRDGGDPACTRAGGVPRTNACAFAKAEGTEIFVIAVMPPNEISGELADTLRACSSEGERQGRFVFLNNAAPENLEAAFAHVANQLITVRRVY